MVPIIMTNGSPPAQSGDRPLTKREQQAIERREQILNAALRLFGRQGFAATTTKQIAQETGVAEGLLFHYFPTKMDLFAAIAAQRQPKDTLMMVLPKVGDHSAIELLDLMAKQFLKGVRHDADFVSMIIGEAQTNPEMGRLLQLVLQRNVEHLAAVLQTRVDQGELRADLPVLASARMFFSSLIVFFLTHRHAGDAEWQANAEPYVTDILDLWFKGARTDG